MIFTKKCCGCFGEGTNTFRIKSTGKIWEATCMECGGCGRKPTKLMWIMVYIFELIDKLINLFRKKGGL